MRSGLEENFVPSGNVAPMFVQVCPSSADLHTVRDCSWPPATVGGSPITAWCAPSLLEGLPELRAGLASLDTLRGWDTLRQAMGQTLSCAERMNLASVRPHGELASTGFCLADPGSEYLVYLPQAGEVTVDLGPASGQMNVEWLCAAEGTLRHAEPVLGGGQRTLRAPFEGDAVLHLWSK